MQIRLNDKILLRALQRFSTLLRRNNDCLWAYVYTLITLKIVQHKAQIIKYVQGFKPFYNLKLPR